MNWMLLVTLAEAKKVKAPPPPPVDAWGLIEGSKVSCYYPADFDKLPDGDRKLARQVALEQMKVQWSGGKEDGVDFEDGVIDDLETALLGRPVLIEQVARDNLEQCTTFAKGGAVDAWRSWFTPLAGKLTAGECLRPLTYTLFDYLEIGIGWQRPIQICKGDRAHISATEKDRYRVSDKGPWINVEGDKEQKVTASDMPCNIEGCYLGTLVGKFETDDGVVTIFPVGTDKVFVAPSNGILSWSINDNTWYDNRYFKSATIEDRVAITLEPAQ